MTDRIKKIYDRLLKRDYRALRTGKTPNCAEEFAREQLSLPRRAGKRLLKLAEAETVKKSQFEMLERISGFSIDQAKDYLLKKLEEHGMTQLGENHDITLDVSRRIYEAAR